MKDEMNVQSQIKREVENNVKRAKATLLRKISYQIRKFFNELLNGV